MKSILYDENNELQTEMTEIIFQLLNQKYLGNNNINIPIEKIKIQSNISQKLNIPNNKSTDLKNKNEPMLIIKNDLCLDFLNPLSFFKRNVFLKLKGHYISILSF